MPRSSHIFRLEVLVMLGELLAQLRLCSVLSGRGAVSNISKESAVCITIIYSEDGSSRFPEFHQTTSCRILEAQNSELHRRENAEFSKPIIVLDIICRPIFI